MKEKSTKAVVEHLHYSYGTTESEEDTETGPLLESELGLPSTAQDSESVARGKASLYIIVLLVTTIILVVLGVDQTSETSLKMLGGRSQIELDALTTVNEKVMIYNKGDYPITDNLKSLPWDTIAEPFRTHILSVDDELANKYTLSWAINGENFSGNGARVRFTVPGLVHECSLSLLSIESGETRVQSFTIAVKYVRREIRTLSTEDRRHTFALWGLFMT